ncbi:hypothetical protein EW026_g3103 [Hermanssonia centrifuga]|uniref:Uncharacterized protein n=1 Tax=Hermanssonia centrifuga TaxID=98765 RepID=A0A4S4KLA1_9APHY|nr:hypothetical protein EW026_g3103 [Hermanssonia centrifuga]
MALSPLHHSAGLLSRRVLFSKCITHPHARSSPARSFFSWFKKKEIPKPIPKKYEPVLTEDNLFHPFSKSPFPAVRARGEAIKTLAPCPVCASSSRGDEFGESTLERFHRHTDALPKAVKHECPDCGWPTHCTEEHWHEDEEHAKYCGRKGHMDSEAAISFANWDLFWYTRGFPSMDTERSRRHASKILTYPLSIGSVLHQHSYLQLSNQRLTPEGSRSLAALRTTLHVPLGTPETEEASADKPQMRIFILGARAESSLPPHVWEQLCMLFPAAMFHLYFIGPQVSLPRPPNAGAAKQTGTNSSTTTDTKETTETKPKEEEKPVYLPNVYEPPTPAPIARLKRTRESLQEYGVPSYTVPYTPQLTITGMQANYSEVHAQFAETFDPYTDCFFMFSPGLGFPSPKSTSETTGEPLLQIASPTEWGPVMPALLATKCPIFVTGFSPADVERDVKSLSLAPEVAGEFDWVITPGPNAFGSEKWEVADFDPRVMVKTNWGVWGIRGKRRDVREKTSWF